MKKLNFEKFSAEIVKADIAKQIVGGYGWEGTITSTSKGTVHYTGLGTADSDCSEDGDSYPSC